MISINNSWLGHFHNIIKIDAQWSEGKILNFNSGLIGFFSISVQNVHVLFNTSLIDMDDGETKQDKTK